MRNRRLRKFTLINNQDTKRYIVNQNNAACVEREQNQDS